MSDLEFLKRPEGKNNFLRNFDRKISKEPNEHYEHKKL